MRAQTILRLLRRAAIRARVTLSDGGGGGNAEAGQKGNDHWRREGGTKKAKGRSLGSGPVVRTGGGGGGCKGWLWPRQPAPMPAGEQTATATGIGCVQSGPASDAGGVVHQMRSAGGRRGAVFRVKQMGGGASLVFRDEDLWCAGLGQAASDAPLEAGGGGGPRCE